MHLIYAVLAIMLVGVFSMNMHRSMHQAQHKMVLNEVTTELTGAAYDVLEHIGRQPFDENTNEQKISPLVYPIITAENQLTQAGGAEWGTCTSLSVTADTCDDLDDFDGVATTVVVDGFQYDVEIDVAYVDPANPNSLPGTRTYAKQVAVTISNTYIRVGGQPLEVTIKRVFTYNRHTQSP